MGSSLLAKGLCLEAEPQPYPYLSPVNSRPPTFTAPSPAPLHTLALLHLSFFSLLPYSFMRAPSLPLLFFFIYLSLTLFGAFIEVMGGLSKVGDE